MKMPPTLGGCLISEFEEMDWECNYDGWITRFIQNNRKQIGLSLYRDSSFDIDHEPEYEFIFSDYRC